MCLLHKGKDDTKLAEKICVMLVLVGRRTRLPVSVASKASGEGPTHRLWHVLFLF